MRALEWDGDEGRRERGRAGGEGDVRVVRAINDNGAAAEGGDEGARNVKTGLGRVGRDREDFSGRAGQSAKGGRRPGRRRGIPDRDGRAWRAKVTTCPHLFSRRVTVESTDDTIRAVLAEGRDSALRRGIRCDIVRVCAPDRREAPCKVVDVIECASYEDATAGICGCDFGQGAVRRAGEERGGGGIESDRGDIVDEIEACKSTCKADAAHAVEVDEGKVGSTENDIRGKGEGEEGCCSR